MKTNRLLVFSLCLLLCCLNLESTRAEQAITVSRYNHVEIKESIASVGRLEFRGDMLYLVDKDGQLIGSAKIEPGLKLELWDVDDSLLGICDAPLATDRLTFSVEGDIVRIGGLQQPTVARVYAIGGWLAMSEPLNPGPVTKLSLASLAKGIYILQINTGIFKIQKK